MFTKSIKPFKHIYFLAIVLVVAFSLLHNGFLVANSYAQPSQAIAEQISQNDAEPNGKQSADSNTTAEEESGNINLSDSIPIDEALEVWEDKFSSILADLGLNNSLHARLAASAAIIVIALIDRKSVV